VLFLLMGIDGRIGLFDGILLFAGILGYILFALRQSRKESAQIEAEYAQEFGGGGDGNASKLTDALPLQIALIVAGLAMLVLGSHWLVEGAVAFARLFGVSELILGLTIVAMGTSLPELATSVVAALRGERDIAVGNVVGSGIFNLLAIAGIAAMVTPGGLEVAPALIRFDIPVMIAVAFACLPVFAKGHLIPRWEGILFLIYYAAYVVYLILDATRHAVLPMFSSAMLGFVLPLTAMTLMVVLVHQRATPR
ncbi:MAG: sodium:calcium antiporter, partial [Rhodocyclaceae bacterium]|nr:sodium:calcium antiporter [Rhodocyclaceae bacterium]